MDLYGWIQLLVFVGVLLLVTRPMGVYLCRVLDPDGKTFLDPVLKPVERIFYRIVRVDPKAEQDWKMYTISLLMFSMVGTLFTYAILRLQHLLPLNPQHLGPVSADLAFNTAISFATNTNWQSYGGESTMSTFSQMVALALHNFTSAATGIAVAAALVRGIARHTAKTIGHFMVDLVRVHLYLLLPLSLLYSLFLVSQGVIQNFKPYESIRQVEPQTQTIVQGPMASQVAIKMLGTNGGGYTNANAAHPYENPTPLSNFIQIFSIFLIPTGLTYYLGRMVKNQGHGWSVWGAMAILFLAGVLLCWGAESAGNPRLHALGVDPTEGNMEGKEVRFGIFGSALFATVTTDASCGAVNTMHDSLTPLGGLVPLVNMHLGEVVFGGVGAGLYGMLVFVILTVFLAGLMVGRTPEYLGKKIESYDVKVSALAVLLLIFDVMVFTAWAVVAEWGLDGMNNTGPHGFSEILYAFSSATANNGSAFAGLTANTPWYNTTLAIAMLVGRFFFMVPVLALAGNLAKKKVVPESGGTFPVSGITFIVLLVGTVLIVGVLSFFPALSLGPIVEHFLMVRSNMVF
ncbi:MAG TPA: potassium-transporting ATPase subunit KdpA [Candidatus Deferrimicrobiaceae bacterium]|nr:potassium-transporting ATPase subunit KdpA [Candidatus Deferrimicrobiaceae bacterium]